ncbi:MULTISPECIES: hypothetical protein [unclassified Variovorax]|uniref:hypothetical protein n=1 Tax=unclassified Variovorax TaxID=663243 RepID=UPI001BD60CAA|nr:MULTISPECIES: hypothetical protein [unclassified Variovorax]
MRLEQHCRWRVTTLNGKGRVTRFHCTEAEIRIEHPEAERIEGTLIERWVPETPEEVAEHERALHASSTVHRGGA